MPDISDQVLESLMYRSEDPSVDYKAEQYIVSRKDLPNAPSLSNQERAALFERKKSELLKDVLAMANAWRDGPAYILLGFKEDKPRPPEVVGISTVTHYDDAQFQQFFEGKLNRPLSLKYEVREFRGKTVGIFTIPKQARPLYAKEPFGVVGAGVVYVRRGSSTAIASPDEIAAMGAEAAAGQRPAVDVRLSFLETSGSAVESRTHRLRVPHFPDKLPDLVPERGPFGVSSSLLAVNRNFWRELADWVTVHKHALPIQLHIDNRSSFALTHCEVHLEAFIEDTPVPLKVGGKQGSAPSTTYIPEFGDSRRPWDRDAVEAKQGTRGSIVVSWDKVLPGARRPAANFFSAFPTLTGTIRLSATLYAAELAEPIRTELQIRVVVEGQDWPLERLQALSTKVAR